MAVCHGQCVSVRLCRLNLSNLPQTMERSKSQEEEKYVKAEVMLKGLRRIP